VDPDQAAHSLNRLLIAQDTGGAIKGGVRGDVFWGHGADAAAIAGRMKNAGRWFLLLPIPVADRL
jgi:membrane-bound lytic murein transglycosylase A